MSHTVSTARRAVTVRTTVRTIRALPDGTSHGYRVDYVDQRPDHVQPAPGDRGAARPPGARAGDPPSGAVVTGPVDPSHGGPWAGYGGAVPAWEAWSPDSGSCGHEHATEDAAQHCAEGTDRDARAVPQAETGAWHAATHVEIRYCERCGRPTHHEVTVNYDTGTATVVGEVAVCDEVDHEAAPGVFPLYLLDADTDRPALGELGGAYWTGYCDGQAARDEASDPDIERLRRDQEIGTERRRGGAS